MAFDRGARRFGAAGAQRSAKPSVVGYRSPADQLAVLALSARRRGVTFTRFWRDAMRPGRKPLVASSPAKPPSAIVWPDDIREAVAWRTWAEANRPEFEAAYRDRPGYEGALAEVVRDGGFGIVFAPGSDGLVEAR